MLAVILAANMSERRWDFRFPTAKPASQVHALFSICAGKIA